MTRQELEARRLSAIPEFSNGTSMAKLAAEYKVSRTSVYRWKRAIDRGEPLAARKAPGRPLRMSGEQERQAIQLWKLGPNILLETETDKWTQARFAEAVELQLGIHYSPDHMGRIMHHLGLTLIKQRSMAR